MTVLSVTDKNFNEEVLNADKPVLVDFWAQWCGPCRLVSPIVDEIANEMHDKLKVVKVNVDEAQELAGSYQIMSIPTLLLFKEGKPVEQIVGAMSKDQLLSKITPKI